MSGPDQPGGRRPRDRMPTDGFAPGCRASRSQRARSRVGCLAMSLMSMALRVHERIYKATDGRLGHRLIGVPTLLLRTTGRRSGATRTNSLVYARDGGDYLIVPSN